MDLDMASDSTFILDTGQTPIGCQLCETGAKIKWKCLQCKLLMCNNCKDKIHIKIARDHEVIDIKDIGKDSLGLKVIKEYSIGIKNVLLMCFSPDGSLWIGDSHSQKIQHIELRPDAIPVLSTFDIKPCTITMSAGGIPYIAGGDGNLKIINESSGILQDTKITVTPFSIWCAHVSTEGNILLGAELNSKGTVFVYNQMGETLAKFESYKDSQLFERPWCITSGTQRQIYVADWQTHRVAIIKSEDHINFYNGHPEINSAQNPLKPTSILRMPSDKILLLDYGNFYLHILDSEGICKSYYYLRDKGIRGAYSLAVSPSGKLYIGCSTKTTDPPGTKAKLYEVECPGV